MTKRDEAEKDYLAGMKYKDIADKYGVTINTVKSWRTRYWNKGAPPTGKRVHPAIRELEDSDLNAKQKAFVIEYIRISNATQAYIIAYDVTYNIAKTNGPRLLENAGIKKEIRRLHKARMAEQSVGVFDLVDDLIKESKTDIRDLVD